MCKVFNPNNIDMFLIVGDSNARKSSTIRCLTGVAQENVYEINTVYGKINQVNKVYVKVSSIQESNMTEQDIVKNMSNYYCNKKIFDTILLSLRIGSLVHPNTGIKYNNADAYINYFKNMGFNIKEIIYLENPMQQRFINNTNAALVNNKPTLTIMSSKTLPSNYIASQVRSQFKWI